MLYLLSHGRDEGHGCRPGANHDDLCTAVVQVLRPELRMYQHALVLIEAWKRRGIGLLVVVIPLAHPQKMAGEPAGFTLVCGLHCPTGVLRGPADPLHAVAIADAIRQPVLLDRFVEIVQNFRRRRNRLALPGFKFVAIGIEVTVGANPRKAKQVPCPAKGVTPLQEEKRFVRAALP